MPHTERHRERKTDGWVYFIQCEKTRRVKIGWAIDPPKRCKDLQCGSPTLLRIVTAEPGTVGYEFALHAKFKRVRLHGEWFKFSGALRRYVETVQSKRGETPWVPEPVVDRYAHRHWKPQPPAVTPPPPTKNELELYARLGDLWLDRVEIGEIKYAPWDDGLRDRDQRALEQRRRERPDHVNAYLAPPPSHTTG